VPRLFSYIQKQQDDISAFWSHQWITDINWHSGVQTIPAANGQKAHAYMGCMPVVTVNVGIPNPHQCCIQIATTLREPGTHKSAYERAKDWMTSYWWVNPATGENWSHGYDYYGTKGKLGNLNHLIFIPPCWSVMVLPMLIYLGAEVIIIRPGRAALTHISMKEIFIRV
jgi:hypothetical protein